LASWIRKNKGAVSRFHEEDDEDSRNVHAGHDPDDGEQIDRPDGIEPLEADAFLRLRAHLWSDLHSIGCSYRRIAKLFGVYKELVEQAIKDVPDFIRVDRRPAERYFDRLRAVMAQEPKNIAEFAELMQRQAGTLGLEGGILGGMGIRRNSVETIIGSPRKSQARKFKASE
jgi:hypothetical protein